MPSLQNIYRGHEEMLDLFPKSTLYLCPWEHFAMSGLHRYYPARVQVVMV